MKKVLFVIENFRIGGIQKSLINLLNSISGMYEIDLAAFDPVGEYRDMIPKDIRIIKLPDHYRTFARPRDALKHSILLPYKVVFFILSKLLNKGKALDIVSPLYKTHKQYDIAISYSHSGYYKGVNGICPEFVLKKTKSNTKICFIHCDYDNSGVKCEYNNILYTKFDKIACCSNSVRKVFLRSNPLLENRTYTVRNFYDLRLLDTIKEDISFNLTSKRINVFSAARLSKEKGIDRAIEALHHSGRNDIDYYIIGEGSLKNELMKMVSNYSLNKQVFFLGSMPNPYSRLLNADYLLVPSLNEAAPMVFDEAKVLGIRVITTNTTSAKEMLSSDDIVCDNSIEGLCDAFCNIYKPMKNVSNKERINNESQIKQFQMLINS